MAENVDNEKIMAGLPKAAFASSKDQVRIRTERFRQMYANSLQVGFSTWDTSITFGEIMGERDGKPLIEETVKIVMTREIAKVFAGILVNHVKAFEEQFGEIKIPVVQEGETEDAAPTVEAGVGEAKVE